MELILSITAIVLSLISLLWQVRSHALDGHRIKVSVGSAIPVGRLDHLPD